jgi:hypothetical protein
MLPRITRAAKRAFAHCDAEKREDAVQDVVTASLINFHRLKQQGKEDKAHPSTLARFAIARYRTGRQAGSQQNSKDVMNPRCQYLNRATVKHHGLEEWENELTAVKSNKNILDQLAFRLDFHDWCSKLSPKDKQIIEDLAKGETMSHIAQKHHTSVTNIARFRKKQSESWFKFIGTD